MSPELSKRDDMCTGTWRVTVLRTLLMIRILNLAYEYNVILSVAMNSRMCTCQI